MKEIILMVGIQASGKTTFVNAMFANTHTIISLDKLKTRYQENLRIKQAISQNQNIVIDNTNVLKTERSNYIETAKQNGYQVLVYYFVPNVKLSLIRNKNANRTEVPRVAIFDKLKKFERPDISEGIDCIYHVENINTQQVITKCER